MEDEEFQSAKAILTRHYITNIYFLLKLFFMQTKIYSKVIRISNLLYECFGISNLSVSFQSMQCETQYAL